MLSVEVLMDYFEELIFMLESKVYTLINIISNNSLVQEIVISPFRSGYPNYLIMRTDNFLTTSNLTLGNRSDPGKRQVQANADDTHNPHGIAKVSSMISKLHVSDYSRTAELMRLT